MVSHVDRVLGSYMWDFVLANWDDFKGFAEKPEFLRLVVQRLAATLSREGVTTLMTDVFGAPGEAARSGPETCRE